MLKKICFYFTRVERVYIVMFGRVSNKFLGERI